MRGSQLTQLTGVTKLIGKAHRRDFIRMAAQSAACVLLAAPLAARAAAPDQTLLVLGDSLSAEYGLARGTGWVALLQRRLTARRIPVNVVNASISGDTTAGGRARLPALLQAHHPAIVVLELGGNDALRGLDLTATQANLAAMTRAAQHAGARVVIVGMQVPPNYGADYARQFAALFAQVAQAQHAALVPCLLKGVADRPDALTLFQSDGIHPTAAAHPTILNNVWAALEPLLPKPRP
jgi:acyl-CoA thioesterase-1